MLINFIAIHFSYWYNVNRIGVIDMANKKVEKTDETKKKVVKKTTTNTAKQSKEKVIAPKKYDPVIEETTDTNSYNRFLFPILLVVIILVLLFLPKIDELLERDTNKPKNEVETNYYEDSIFDVLTCTKTEDNVTTTHYLYNLNKTLKHYITTTESKSKSLYDTCGKLEDQNKNTKGFEVRCYNKKELYKQELKVDFDEYNTAIGYDVKFAHNTEIDALKARLTSDGYTCTDKKG